MSTSVSPQSASLPVADVACVGGINLDRKLKAAGLLQMGSSNLCTAHESPGGVARNVAENLARLGFSVRLIGQVGRDGAARAILTPLQGLGVDTSACRIANGGSTGSYTAVLNASGELVLGMADMALTEALMPEQLQTIRTALEARLWLADMNLPSASLTWLTEQARIEERQLVMLAVSEPKASRIPQDLRGIDTLLLNRGELIALGQILGWGVGWRNELEKDPASGVNEAFAKLHARGLQRLVVTHGKHGVWCKYFDDSQAIHLLPEAPAGMRVIDETGAGDALCAGLCGSYLRYPDQSLASHVQRALRLAALAVQSAETVNPSITPECI